MADTLTIARQNRIAAHSVSVMNSVQSETDSHAGSPAMQKLISEGGEYFVRYLTGLGFDGDTELMIFSARREYYYGFEDLNGVSVLVNLRSLNSTRHLSSFLHTVADAMNPGACLIGCFTDSHTASGNDKAAEEKSMTCSGMRNAGVVELDKAEVGMLLHSNSLKLADMMEINGRIYFMAIRKAEAKAKTAVYDFLSDMIDEYSKKAV